MRLTTFAIDYDGTYTVDPDLWRSFIEQAHARGHTVVMVTGRSNEGQFGSEVRAAVQRLVPVVFAAQMWKRHAAQLAGYDVNVWIEDHPEAVGPQGLLLNDREQNGKCSCGEHLSPRHVVADNGRYTVFVCLPCENNALTRLARGAP